MRFKSLGGSPQCAEQVLWYSFPGESESRDASERLDAPPAREWRVVSRDRAAEVRCLRGAGAFDQRQTPAEALQRLWTLLLTDEGRATCADVVAPEAMEPVGR